MVTASVDNSPISIQLNDGESTTVPTGETWKVDFLINGLYDIGNSYDEGWVIKINGSWIACNQEGVSQNISQARQDVILTAGDTIAVQFDYDRGSKTALAIQGLVIG